MAYIRIVSFPIKNFPLIAWWIFPVRYVNVYKRVSHSIRHDLPVKTTYRIWGQVTTWTGNDRQVQWCALRVKGWHRWAEFFCGRWRDGVAKNKKRWAVGI